jgi:hypothetical protein
MQNLPPLSGAILISNPRREPTMALALDNPNYYRRRNLITRAILSKDKSYRTPSTAQSGVQQWLRDSKKPKHKRAKWMQRVTAGVGKKKGGPGIRAILAGRKKTSPARRKLIADTQKAVVREFQRQGKGYGGKAIYMRSFGPKHGGFRKSKRKASWQVRARASKAGAYLSKSKQQKYKTRYPNRKLGMIGNYMVVDVDGVRNDDARKLRARKAKATKRRKAPVRRRKTTKRRKSRARANGLALTNGSALLNPSFGNLGGWFTGYALPIAVAGAAAGGIHAFANFGMWDISNKINDMVIKVPWAGERIVTYLPNTFQGLLAGAALGVVATKAKGDVRKYLGLTSVAVLSVGAAMDAYNLAAARLAASSALPEEGLEDLGALALDNFGALALDNMGALALDNMGALALDNLGDGMAYETAPLAGEQLYGQATLGDAYYSGADFSLGEGQALLNGSQVWTHKFGRPAMRTKRAAGSASHLAGTRGHRWGWLIKLVGFQRAGSIAAMKPKQRLSVIKSLRTGAIKGYQQATLEQRARAVQAATPSVEELVAKTSAAGHGQIAPQGAGGPCGPGGLELAYGDPALFMS